ncbi:MAG TPA: SigB/SigF/SigG family RNA polymerase sigma factor [Candidatus Xenobia bacterium]|jgi:RNA polymerase sigma-B factor
MTTKAKTQNDKVRTKQLLSEFHATGARQILDELVGLHHNLVRYVASKFVGRGEPLEDLVQIGMIGLVKAIERYDVAFGAQFATFAMPTIMGEIRRYLRDHGSALKISRAVHELRPAVLRTMELLSIETGSAPTAAVIAQKLNTTEERVLEVIEMNRAQSLISLDAPASQNEDALVPALGFVDDQLMCIENRLLVQKAMECLTEREHTVIYNRYFKQATQNKVAEIIGVSQMQVSRLERAALTKMRTELEQAAVAC